MSQTINVKPFHKGKEHGVKMTIKLDGEGLPGAERPVLSEREIKIAKDAFRAGRFGKVTDEEYIAWVQRGEDKIAK